MKKQIVSKLSVNKVTVTHLNAPAMNEIKGGYITATCPDFGCPTKFRCTIGCPSVNPYYCND